MLSEIIVGDAFGVDRMDYLLRDSLHAGVQYGRFDHHRLVDTLRILPKSDERGQSGEPTLGLEFGGLHSAETMLMARYSMFAQLYLHPVRRAYDRHLIQFLSGWLPGGTFPVEPEDFIAYTDIQVLAAIAERARSTDNDPTTLAAKRIAQRDHFKRVYSGVEADRRINLEPGNAIAQAISNEFGDSTVIHDALVPGGSLVDFPVLQPDGRIASSLNVSSVLPNIPVAAIDYVFVESSIRDSVSRWLEENRQRILKESEPALNGEGGL